MSFLNKIFKSYSERELKRVDKIKEKVLSYEEEYTKLSDEELKAKTDIFRQRLENGETLDDILPEAFATCREAAWRVLKMRHYPVQILGGIVLHQGRVAEMKTGEGKTLVATLPAYLNALAGNGVHIVTVNDYLAKRDSEWMGKVYRFLGLTVGLIVHEKDDNERRAAYACDITFGTNNELGFDYLRDNLVVDKARRVQRGHAFAIVDEVDSILIDEARTPLIISGQGEESSELYVKADDFVRRLKCVRIKELDEKSNAEDITEEQNGDYLVAEKEKTSTLTEQGMQKAERFFGVEDLSAPENLTVMHHINQALKAHGTMQRDVDYIVQDDQVLIVDEFTGRIMYGRRFSEGLHQALEAKERVKVASESKTLATITFQNFFRLYKKLSGMTGTAMTESAEFQEIYNLDVVEIPTNKPMIRNDIPDTLFKEADSKFKRIVEKVTELHAKGQPVLVGTVSVEMSEHVSSLLRKAGVPHTVLNAKYHEKEAEIIAQAGRFGAVTIATNMAGRGTDIILGGNPEFMARVALENDPAEYTSDEIGEATGFADTNDARILAARELYREKIAEYKIETDKEAEKVRAAGGLYIIGTERHESRRVDNQLRGRSGRQGDPGTSQFFLSAEDDMIRLFAGDKFQRIMDTFKSMGEELPPVKMLASSIESAQKRVESNNFAIRKNVTKYDDVVTVQRGIIYEQRNQVLDKDDIGEIIRKMIGDTVEESVAVMCPAGSKKDDWQFEGLCRKYCLDSHEFEGAADSAELSEKITEKLLALYEERKEKYYYDGLIASAVAESQETGIPITQNIKDELRKTADDTWKLAERATLLTNVDRLWMAHIDALDELKRGISLRAYAQKDPLVAFREECYDMFDELSANIREETVNCLLFTRPVIQLRQARILSTSGSDSAPAPARKGGGKKKAKPAPADSEPKQQPIKKGEKVGPNDPCPCGSGKKYKKCCRDKDIEAMQ